MKRKDYPPEWRQIALRIKNKANWKCQICGTAPSNKQGKTLGVHHKDGDPINNNDSNLIALCQPCHLREQIKLQPYIQRKAKEKEGQLSFASIPKPY